MVRVGAVPACSQSDLSLTRAWSWKAASLTWSSRSGRSLSASTDLGPLPFRSSFFSGLEIFTRGLTSTFFTAGGLDSGAWTDDMLRGSAGKTRVGGAAWPLTLTAGGGWKAGTFTRGQYYVRGSIDNCKKFNELPSFSKEFPRINLNSRVTFYQP